MHNHDFPNEEIILDEYVKFGPARLVYAFSEMEEPCVQGTRRVAGLYVVAQVIRFKFCDFGVNGIFVEIV